MLAELVRLVGTWTEAHEVGDPRAIEDRVGPLRDRQVVWHSQRQQRSARRPRQR